MEKVINVSILVLLVIVGVISIMGLSKLNAIVEKLDTMPKADATGQNNATGPQRDVSASEFSSALRAKLSGSDVSELNVKFQ